jgi:pyrroloquinoline quinone biosynthesis protein B
MRILVLGAAAGGGFPQWNSNSTNCQRARSGDPLVPPRSQSSLAVSANGSDWYLLNASPDLRQQIFDNPQLHPRQGIRDSGIAGVVLTNGDVDHVTGLLTLRERYPLSVYATARIHAVLKANPIFEVLNPEFVERRELTLGQEVELCDQAGTPSGIGVEAFAVPGKVALYLEDESAGENFGTVAEDTIGLRICDRSSGRNFFYIPGCAALSDDLAARVKNAPLLFFDGTLWRDDEMIVQGAGSKTGQRMGHLSMSGSDGAMALLAGFGIERRVFIHINNTNPVLAADSPERAEVESNGWEVAWDGMELSL